MDRTEALACTPAQESFNWDASRVAFSQATISHSRSVNKQKNHVPLTPILYLIMNTDCDIANVPTLIWSVYCQSYAKQYESILVPQLLVFNSPPRNKINETVTFCDLRYQQPKTEVTKSYAPKCCGKIRICREHKNWVQTYNGFQASHLEVIFFHCSNKMQHRKCFYNVCYLI